MRRYDPDLTLQFVRICLSDPDVGNWKLQQEILRRRIDRARILSDRLFDSADDFRAWMRDHGIVREERSG